MQPYHTLTKTYILLKMPFSKYWPAVAIFSVMKTNNKQLRMKVSTFQFNWFLTLRVKLNYRFSTELNLRKQSDFYVTFDDF